MLLAAGALGVAGSCTTEETADPGTAEGRRTPETLVVGLATEPDSLNVYLARTAESLLVANRILPRLWKEILPDARRELGFEPQLARGDAVFEDDRLTMRVPLSTDLTWSDGSPVRCQDVRFTYQVQTDPKLGWRGASIKRHIEEVSCPEAHEAVFHFQRSYPEQQMDANDLHVLSRGLADVPLDRWREIDWSRRLPTAGPYRVAESVPGERLVLERDESHPVDRPGNVERIVFRVVPDSLSRVTQLRSGDLHLVESLPADAAGRLEGDNGVRLIRRPAWHYVYIGWNTVDPERYRAYRRAREQACAEQDQQPCPDDAAEVARLATEHPHPLLGEAKVRRALTMAIDRRAILDNVLGSEGTIPSSPILSPLPEHDPGLEPWPHDPERARRLLAQAGFEDRNGDGTLERGERDFELTLLHHAGNQIRRDAGVMIQRDLGQIGVRVKLEPVDGAGFYSRLSGRRHDAWIARWRVSSRVDMTEMLHERACGFPRLNFGSWSDGQADDLALSAREEPDAGRRAELWHRWERRFRQQQPYTLLFRANHLVGVSARLEGTESMLSNDVLNGVERWRLGRPEER